MDESIKSNKKWIVNLKKVYQYLIKTLNGMAYGLFATLIVGVIVSTIGGFFDAESLVGSSLLKLGNALKSLMGVGIGFGIAWSLDLKGLKMISGGITGGIATLVTKSDPMVCYITVVASIELVRLILRKATPIDIIIIPLLTSLFALVIALIIGTPVAYVMSAIGSFIDSATTLHPFLMGIVIAVIMGMCLTAPISSAAIAISLKLSGLAGGAAVVGCCVQMLGFAVMGARDNNVGVTISTAIGTSMLQFKNIMKKPIIWLPTIIVSAILGPLSTLVFKVQCDFSGSGMGTSGLVGQIATYSAMGNTKAFWLALIILEIILPIVLVFVVDLIFRKFKLIKPGDLKL